MGEGWASEKSLWSTKRIMKIAKIKVVWFYLFLTTSFTASLDLYPGQSWYFTSNHKNIGFMILKDRVYLECKFLGKEEKCW